MDFIVLDLEWNQKKRSKYRMRAVNEIMEIGAVKVRGGHEIVEEFRAVIRPVIYTEGLHPHVEDIVHIEEKDLQEGTTFAEAVTAFAAFCGEDMALCSWGSEDILILLENLAYYELDMGFVRRYYDLQQAFAQQLETDGRSQRGLSAAVEMLNIEPVWDFHGALNDARYTAQILLCMDKEKLMQANEGFFRLRSQQEKMMARQVQAIIKPGQQAFTCPVCGEETAAVVVWYGLSTRRIVAIARCGVHGYFARRLEVRPGDAMARVRAVKQRPRRKPKTPLT